MKVLLGFKISRLNKKRECVSTLKFHCNCCENEATIELQCLKIKKNGKHEKVVIKLCDKHLKELKDTLNYF